MQGADCYRVASTIAWERVGAVLNAHGRVSVDGFDPRSGEPASMTLHFPELDC